MQNYFRLLVDTDVKERARSQERQELFREGTLVSFAIFRCT